MHPTFGNGKICYIEIPATDVAISAGFYEKVFGWHLRRRDDGSTAFDDGVGEVSGTWLLGRPPSSTPSLMIQIMVDDMPTRVEETVANSCEMMQPAGGGSP